MKLATLQGTRLRQSRRRAFTLIEMIGVLAVIAILASMLIPRVFQAIDSARVNSTAVSCETVKTAIADHYGKYGAFDQIFGTNKVTYNGGGGAVGSILFGYDTNVLMIEQLLDKPFSAKIAGGDPSTNSIIQLVQGGPGNGQSGYALAGVNGPTTTNATFVVEAVIFGVSQADAKDLNDRIDGTALGAPIGSPDNAGRVEYSAGSNPTTVYIYLTHR
jgi:prepilin-type N-terminal cleavage/methylation domain-containing protein